MTDICAHCIRKDAEIQELEQTITNLKATIHFQGNDKLIGDAERRGWNAGRLAKNGCVVSIDYNEGGGWAYSTFESWQRSKGKI